MLLKRLRILADSMDRDNNWITLDYLELYCERNQLVVGCEHEEDELWISSLGPHPSSLTADEVHHILDDSVVFEVRAMNEEESPVSDSIFLTRMELEQRIRKMLN